MSQNIIKNSAFNVAFKGFNVLYPMVTSAYISRIFLADGVGRIMFVINIVTYFSLAASLGIPSYAVKVLSGCRDDKKSINSHFTELAIILTLASLIASSIYYYCINYIYIDNPQFKSLAWILGLIIVSNITNYDWLFESFEDFKFLAVRSIVVKSFLLCCMFLFVDEKKDILIYCAIYAGISVLNNIWNYLSYKKYATFTKNNINLKLHVKPVLFLFSATFATEVYTLLDSTMLGLYCKPEILGYFSNASKIVRSFYGVLFAIIAVYNPRLSYLYGKKDYTIYKSTYQQYYNLAIFLSIPSSFLLFFTSKEIILLMFGTAFEPATETLQILSILIIIFSMATVFGHFALIIYSKEQLLLIATITGAILNFSLNSILIPYLQHNGAAIASVISEFIVTILLMMFSIRSFKITIINKNLLTTLLSSLAMILSLYILRKIEFSLIVLRLLANFTIGSVVFVSFSILLKNQTFVSIYSRLKKGSSDKCVVDI